MKEAYFTLIEDCTFEDQQLNKGDIVLLVPVPADDKSVREWFEEDKVDYKSLISFYTYSREEFINAAQEGDWIFSRMPKHCTYLDSIFLPDLFLELPIVAEEVELGDIEVIDLE